jgi:hypothetical protein
VGFKLLENVYYYVPVHWLVPVLMACHFFISACPSTPQMYLNSFASYFCISGLQTCSKFMLVCASPSAGPLAGDDGLSFYFISACPPMPQMYVKSFASYFCISGLQT